MSQTKQKPKHTQFERTEPTMAKELFMRVTACWLEQKNNDGSWTTVCSLAAPSVVSQNDFSYSATMDYSSEIGTGTYRIRAVYNADGHAITRYSNERTFSN